MQSILLYSTQPNRYKKELTILLAWISLVIEESDLCIRTQLRGNKIEIQIQDNLNLIRINRHAVCGSRYTIITCDI